VAKVVYINVDTGRTERGNCHWGNKYFDPNRCVKIGSIVRFSKLEVLLLQLPKKNAPHRE
jgi:hypothetical protein